MHQFCPQPLLSPFLFPNPSPQTIFPTFFVFRNTKGVRVAHLLLLLFILTVTPVDVHAWLVDAGSLQSSSISVVLPEVTTGGEVGKVSLDAASSAP